MKFILWDQKDGPPTINEDGTFRSGGLLGELTKDNVYLTTYANYHGDKRPKDLKVGECIRGVGFHLSGESGSYDVWRTA